MTLTNMTNGHIILFMNKRMLKKRQIMEKSINVMFEHGYHGTGIKDLTDAAGIPKGSLYNYYENKEDYAREALRYFHQVMSADYFELLNNDSKEPVQRIRDFYGGMIEHIRNKGNDFKGCFIGKMTQELGGTNDSIQEVIQEINEDIIGTIANNLDEARTKGLITTHIPSDVLAETINSSWQGALQSIKATRNLKPLDNYYLVLTEITLK